MNIHLISHGNGDIPLVFFHGFGFDNHIWLSLVPYLKEEFRLFLVDLPGFGLSAMQDWELFKHNLLVLLPKQFILIGWSLGGLYATRLAIEEPVRILSLLNIASTPRFMSDKNWPGIPKLILDNFYARLYADAKATLQDFIDLQLNKQKLEFELGCPPSKEGLKKGLEILTQWDLRKELFQLKIRTCFMFGRLDPITSVKTMHKMQESYPKFKYILFEKAAHMPFLSHRELFMEHFFEHLKEIHP